MSESKQIVLRTYGDSQKLGRVLNVSQPTIRKALRFESDTDTARRIRHTAVKAFGGVEIPARNNQ